MAADSLTLTTDQHQSSLVGLHAIDAVGRLLLRTPAHSCLVTEVLAHPGGRVATLVEVTDVAAVAVRDRIRARVTVHGSVTLNFVTLNSLNNDTLVHPGTSSEPPPDAQVELRVQVHGAELVEGGTTTVVDPVAFAAVEADPLCRAEPDMLLHMHTAHRDAVGLLARLVEPRLLQAVVAVTPYALDRYGIVLRLERLAGHRDVRIRFAERAADVPHAQRQLNALLAVAARARPCGQTLL